MKEHIHSKPTFMVNGKITCKKCHTEKGGNECFCTCHRVNEDPGKGEILQKCGKCLVYHD